MAKSITAGRLRVSRPQRAVVPASDDMRRRVTWLIGALGNNRVAELLGVSRSQPSRWKSGEERVAFQNRRAVLDLEYIMARLYEIWTPDVAAIWLDSANPHLGGAKPMDVLRQGGAADVIVAVDAADEGAYAQLVRLYRVLPWVRDAAVGAPGHPIYVPQPRGTGRVDNRGRYRVMYLSSAPAGAVAETFGEFELWSETMFARPALAGSVRALVTYDLPDQVPIFDLDDVRSLEQLGLRPSEVVTRDRTVTQRWALAIFEQRRWAGVRWWSYYDPRWYSYALWDLAKLRPQLDAIEPLTMDHGALIEAADVLHRPRRS